MTDNDMQRLWTEASDISSRLTEMRSIDTQAAYRNVRHKVRSNRLRRAAATMFSRAAAVLVLPLIMSTATLYYMYTHDRSHPSATAMVEVTAPAGTTARVMLPDSSEVWLNSDSRLFYHICHATPPSFHTKHNGQPVFPVRVFVMNVRRHFFDHEDTEATDIAFLR